MLDAVEPSEVVQRQGFEIEILLDALDVVSQRVE